MITTFFFINVRRNKKMSQDKTIYATGNGVKLDDLKAVLGQDIINQNLKPTEIQAMPIRATEDKIRRCFEAVGGADVCCEETSFGTGELATFIKQIVDTCEQNGGDLHNVWKAVAPRLTEFDYTSIVAFKNAKIEAFFECIMKCAICPRSADGKIDPFAVPIQYTLVQTFNGVRTILAENILVDNPEQLSIAQQPKKRDQLHPRYFSVRAYKEWRTKQACLFEGNHIAEEKPMQSTPEEMPAPLQRTATRTYTSMHLASCDGLYS